MAPVKIRIRGRVRVKNRGKVIIGTKQCCIVKKERRNS
jgi:hypothetical protein